MTTRDEYVAKMKAQLDEMNSKLDKLAVKSETAKNKMTAKYKQEMADVRAQAKHAGDRLSELKESGEESWDSSVAELEKISAALKHSYSYFKSQI